MIVRVVCEGAPRDLGLDQGRACRSRIRAALDGPKSESLWAALAAAWRLGPRPGSPGESFWRSCLRHYPHFAERALGLAAGARVPLATLVEKLAASAVDARLRFEITWVDRRGASGGVAGLTGALPVGSGAGSGLVLRESRVEGGYRSLELAPPWSPGAVAGVNEEGLAAAWQAFPGDPSATQREAAARAQLLLQQCLERLDAVQKGVEWCEGRPCGRGGVLLFADARGDAASVVLGEASPSGAPARELPKREPTAELTSVRLDPRARRLVWSDAGGRTQIFGFDGSGVA